MRSVPEESKLKGPYVSILLILCELVKFLQDREVYYPMCYAMNARTARLCDIKRVNISTHEPKVARVEVERRGSLTRSSFAKKFKLDSVSGYTT